MVSRLYPARPIVGVGVVVLRDDAVLLIRRARPPREGQWSLPGGAQKTGESVVQAALREVREETGVDVEVRGLLDVIDSIQEDPDGRVRYHYTLVDVYAEWRAGEPVAEGDALQARWWPISEIPRLDLWSATLRMIELALDRRRDPRSTELLR